MDAATLRRSALVPRQDPNGATDSTAPESSTSLSGLLATLLPLLITAGVYVSFFLWFRFRRVRFYQPRTYLGSLRDYQKTPKTESSMFGWIKQFFSLPDTFVLNHHSLDAYLFLRFFRTMIIISFVGACITWPILFPVNATGGGGLKQFELLTYGNVDVNTQANRYYAHVFCLWIFFTFVLYILGRETLHFLALRQAYFLSPMIASRISARTVVFTDVPEQYLDEQVLRKLFPGVKHVWIATDANKLAELVQERDKTAIKLEGAELALSRDALKRKIKAKDNTEDPENPLKWLDEKKRPTHRLKPLIGKKVDSIEWCRSHLQKIIPEVEQGQESHWNGKEKYASAVFIEFETTQSAQSAFQQQVSRLPKRFQPRAIGAPPKEIIWANLNMKWLNRDIRLVLARALITVTIIFWAIPISFGGFLSNIFELSKPGGSLEWLSFLNVIPPAVRGVVTGLLPVIWVAVLMALVPIFCRFVAKKCGAVTLMEVELHTQNWYFGFQVVNVFLITTFASAASSVITDVIGDPSLAPSLLAQNIPKAGNFYVNFFVLQGVGISFGLVAAIAGFFISLLLAKFLDNSPRKIFNRYTTIGGYGWGSLYPPITLFGVIVLVYSIISPLVLGFATCGLTLLYGAYRYNVFFTVNAVNLSGYGASYAKALQHMMVGIYIAEVCFIGLMAIATGSGTAAATGPLILAIIYLVFTFMVHSYFRGMVKPLMEALPRDVLTESQDKTAAASQPGASAVPALEQSKETSIANDELAEGNGNGVKPSNDATPMLATADTSSGPKKLLHWLLHPNTIPQLAPHFSEPEPEYPDNVRREAYLNPAITSPVPFLWIAQDPLGISKREVLDSGKVVGITDDGAWFDEKAKLNVAWQGQEEAGEENKERSAPIYDKPIQY